MNLLWIAVPATAVLVERVLPFGTMPARMIRLAMLAGGLRVLWAS